MSPPAVRLRRPGWRDPRLLLGVVLVAGSVALGSGVVAAASSTVPVYAAGGPIVAGEPLAADRLQVRHVRFTETDHPYLSAQTPIPDDLVVVRTVGAGELVPLSSLGQLQDLDFRSVAVTPRGTLTSGLVEGSTVDLWFVPAVRPGSDGSQTVATPLATGLTVAELSEPRAFTVGTAVTVHVLVPVDQLADVLQALAADGTVEIVLVPGGLTAVVP